MANFFLNFSFVFGDQSSNLIHACMHAKLTKLAHYGNVQWVIIILKDVKKIV